MNALLTPIKLALVKLFILFIKHDKVKAVIAENIPNQKVIPSAIRNEPSPYQEPEVPINATRSRSDIVFVTSRFRSGSTALWNAFRENKACTAYYEPFNERQWFNPEVRGSHTDSTHLGVNDYWTEYNDLEDAGNFYQEKWIREDLLMDENSWNQDMLSYIDFLIESTNKTPVFQFNRVDFRLQWLKKHYPNAKIIHLYRNPRDQWCSFLTDKTLLNKDDVAHTYKDGFYLNSWCNDLKTHFPFLSEKETPHPYGRFYYLWKLSYLYGKQFSDISIQYEELNSKPIETLENVFSVLGWDGALAKESAKAIQQSPVDKWKGYADKEWFGIKEASYEYKIQNFLDFK